MTKLKITTAKELKTEKKYQHRADMIYKNLMKIARKSPDFNPGMDRA